MKEEQKGDAEEREREGRRRRRVSQQEGPLAESHDSNFWEELTLVSEAVGLTIARRQS